jgi:hypothetical protein
MVCIAGSRCIGSVHQFSQTTTYHKSPIPTRYDSWNGGINGIVIPKLLSMMTQSHFNIGKSLYKNTFTSCAAILKITRLTRWQHVKCYKFFHSISAMTCRSRWPHGLVRRSWPLGYWDRGFESFSRHGYLSLCFCVVLSCVGRDLCDGLITRPKKSCHVS